MSTSSGTGPHQLGQMMQDSPIADDHDAAHASEQVAKSVMPRQISITAQTRMQLRQRFYDLHFGANGRPSRVYTHDMVQGDGERTALTIAMDTVCVAQLATTFEDERLAQTCSILYHKAIHRLNRDIQLFRQGARQSGVSFAVLVCAADVLVGCAWFTCVCTRRWEWMSHWKGSVPHESVLRSLEQVKAQTDLFSQECSVCLIAAGCKQSVPR